MANWKVNVTVDSWSKPGISPTEKAGIKGARVAAGTTFSDVGNVRGWLAMASNKWIPASACSLVGVTPPPDDDPPPVVDPATFDYIEMRRISHDGGLSWTAWEFRGIKVIYDISA